MPSSAEDLSEELSETEGQTFESGVFDAFRRSPFPTFYGPIKSPVTADVLEAGFFYAICILALCFLLILPGAIFRKRLLFFVKFVTGLFILVSIFLCNFGQEWEVAEVHAETQYKAGLKRMINAEITVKIGLRSVNITLKAHDNESETVDFGTHNEMINYNERFSWDNTGWTQGRAGFGPFAGKMNQEFRAGQFRGLPYPILWIAEYFVPDGEGIRWGRFYRQAGYYSHIFMWLAFPLFVLSVLLIMMVRSYGALFFMMTGASMIGGNLCFGLIRNPTQLKIPFEPDALVFRWGWCFWLCLVTGIVNIVLGMAAFVLDFVSPDWLADFLNIDVTKDYEEFYLSREELENLGITIPKDSKCRPSQANGASNHENLAANDEIHGFRKRLTGIEGRFGTTRFAKGRATTRYKILNHTQRDNDENIKAAAFGRPEKERPALPKRFAGRPPVASPAQSGFDNPVMMREINFDSLGEPDMDTSHSLNMDARNQDKGNYDNVKPGDMHVRYHRTPDVPHNSSLSVPMSPYFRLPTSKRSTDESESDEDAFQNTSAYASVIPPPIPPRSGKLTTPKVTFNIKEPMEEENDEDSDREEYIRLYAEPQMRKYRSTTTFNDVTIS